MIFTAYKLLDVVQFRVFCLTGPIQVHQYYNIQKYNIPTVTYVSQTWTLALKSKKKKKEKLTEGVCKQGERETFREWEAL